MGINKKIYLRIDKKDFRKELEDLLFQYYENIEFEWYDYVMKLTIYDNKISVYSLKQFIKMVHGDFAIKISCLVVPKFDGMFIKYLNMFNNDVLTLFDVFIKNINNDVVYKDAKNIIKDIPIDYLLTAKAFIDCDMNATLAAKELYLHRNSYNYRLNKFIEKSGIEIHEYDNAIFMQLIFNILS